MCESSHCHAEHSCSFCELLRRLQQKDCEVPLRIDRPTMLKWNSRHMTSFAKETGDHLLQTTYFSNNFRWICLVFEDPHGQLLFCFGLIRIDP
uniref:Uncharacterized protein n=1 Tax=Lepeophtheirus salmonis TaxID=72036 RepID=A0A0K2T6I6_LEPSM